MGIWGRKTGLYVWESPVTNEDEEREKRKRKSEKKEGNEKVLYVRGMWH